MNRPTEEQAQAAAACFYVAFFNGRKLEPFQAATLLDAHRQAVAAFKAPKSRAHMVAAYLVAVDDRTVTHTPDT